MQSKSATERLVFRIPGMTTLRIPLIVPKPETPLSSILLLAYGFGALIILGMILLVLPISSASGEFTSPLNALFTATSAVCVTGLVVMDTGTYWSIFGQGVLFALFQIGGLGFIVGATLLLLAIGGRFGLRERLLITESIGIEQLGGVLGIVIRIAAFAFISEAAGAAIFYFHWLAGPDPGFPLWTAVFHAASAFNNCGMDIFGNFKSLADSQTDAVILLVTALLVILGGTGYVVVADILKHKSFAKLSLDSKIVLTTTCSLFFLGTLFYLVAEFSGSTTLGPLPLPQKMLVAFFQSVTPRTAGFTAIDIGGLRQISLFFTMFLMCVGGATGSTAGGVKVNVFGVLGITLLGLIRGKEVPEAFGRQVPKLIVFRAISLFLFYLAILSLVVIALSVTETFPIDSLIFEAFSSLSTVGLSTGITPALSIGGRIIIVIAMFTGRLAPLAFMAFLVHRHKPSDIDYPHENIRLG